jgi:cation diffusion facilitator CzcD-associated flavoprotein CzcO
MSLPDAASPVLVIGGGAAGLSTAAALARRGIHAMVLEQDDGIGGSWARRYECLKLHTIRRYSGLAHYPIPGDRPRYLSKNEYATYLQEYAHILGLDVSLGERVKAVREIPGSSGMEWEVVTNRTTRRAKTVVIATGQCAQARLPTWPGIDGFTGSVLHSSHYQTGAAYSGQRVLVIGLGNSGAEIATDLAKHGAASVSVSVRTTPPVVTREMFKIVPVQLFGIMVTKLGMPCLFDRIGATLRQFTIGELSEYGLGDAAWEPFSARRPAVIDAGFLKQLKQGRILVRPDISRFDSTCFIYTDGSSETIDVVIAATGFRSGLEKFLHVPGVLDDNGQPQFLSGGPTSIPGLYFVGFDETVRGQLYEINRESLQLAVEIERYLAR